MARCQCRERQPLLFALQPVCWRAIFVITGSIYHIVFRERYALADMPVSRLKKLLNFAIWS